ncbi:WD repeat domain 43 [Columba livia]|uniref:WD repeat domain 43 n=1 Tax=Columba livia TaxID=8932 RepID=A0A2I0LVJ2_COLLI|nr:WD repeat domain 43 [Columba livia]
MGGCGCGRRRAAACSTSTCLPPTSALPVRAWPGPRRGDARPPARMAPRGKNGSLKLQKWTSS